MSDKTFHELVKELGYDGDQVLINQLRTQPVRDLADEMLRLLFVLSQNGDFNENHAREKLENVIKYLKQIDQN